MKLRKAFTGILAFAVLAWSMCAQTKETTKNGTILHCWCWSFKTIEQNMQKIADAGFTALQTSPANTCLVGDSGGLELMSIDTNGKWYYHYQPTDWKIGNYQLGTRDDFIAMCKAAEKYGIAVIVDVLPNHTTPRKDKIEKDFIDAVGGMDKLYHEKGLRGIGNWGNRFEVINQQMGGLPDVNTENPLFQSYFMKYMNDLIDCGADGFRFDTAKHIALPDDPKDEYSPVNNFWLIFTGLEPVGGVYLKNAKDLFLYGEVLQGGASREDAYGKYIAVTASSYGGILRSAIYARKMSAKGLADWKNDAGAERLVTWIESHDTYANKGESAAMKNFQLRAGYALIAARKDGTPLFFNRPQGAEGVQFPKKPGIDEGISKIGDIGNDQFMHPEVSAVNKFRTAMSGESEELLNGSSLAVLIIKRGEKGVVIINDAEKGSEKIEILLALPDGVYKDKANGLKFKVKDGILTGKVPHEKIAVIY